MATGCFILVMFQLILPKTFVGVAELFSLEDKT
jgi:hypothetical protein